MANSEFIFTARNASGALIKGKIKAKSEMDVRAFLRSKNHQPVSVTRLGQKSGSILDSFSSSISPGEFQIFLRQLSVLLKSGVPLLESLYALEESSASPALKKVLGAVVEDVKEGKPLSDALAKHPKTFQKMVVNLIQAGEQGAVVDEVLDRLAIYYEKRKKLRSKVISAMIYPIITIAVATGALSLILIYVIPKFEELFKNQGQELPALTRFVMRLSEGFVNNWMLIFTIVFIAPVVLVFLYKSGTLTRQLDSIFLKIPLFGDLIKKSAVARMSRTLSTLLKSGIRINDGIDITIGTMGNVIIDEHMMIAKESIMSGQPLEVPLKQSGFFPSIVVQMVSIGGKTGKLDSMLEKVADFYEDEVEQSAERLTSLLEPLVIVFLGGTIGTLVIAMFLPILKMGSAFV